ncbi:hypothetical protein Misp01_29390 [Microtetraspora sp. NBRC 13810]|uniref:hypothetical protein n=1 Tax=Microtetraspora sp. NBRC 13810 TaxID=3030990 RepID=UPI0024A4F622|nr:hypothetical protein [Microtetraspora sp. NBRC 13810]GLW07809.1 hypothetical protein Misp01_29390 [Microtetraspora sp. NBRC 13810]
MDPREQPSGTAPGGPSRPSRPARPGGHRPWRRRPARESGTAFDPSLPDDVARLLRDSPDALRAARAQAAADGTGADPWGADAARRAAAWLRTGAGPRLFTIFVLIGCLVLVAGLTNVGGLLLAMTTLGAIGTVRWVTTDAEGRRERRLLRAAAEHADRYVLPEDLDRVCLGLLRRAQDAADAVLAAQVTRAGLIDTIDNRVTLPEETWRIARQLARLSAMSAEHRSIVPPDVPPEVASAFTPYNAALEAAAASLTARVRTLEEYAWQVHRADQVYRAFRQLEVLAERTPDYERLVADLVRDELARPHIERLADQAEQVRELFQQSVDGAREAAAHLLTGRRDPAGDLR